MDPQPLWSVFPVSGIQTHQGRPRAGRQAGPPDGTAQPFRSRPGRRQHRVAARERDLVAGAYFRGAMSRRAPSRQGSRAAARSRYTLMDMNVRSLTMRFLRTAVAVLAAAVLRKRIVRLRTFISMRVYRLRAAAREPCRDGARRDMAPRKYAPATRSRSRAATRCWRRPGRDLNGCAVPSGGPACRPALGRP